MRSGVMLGFPVPVRLVTRSTLSTGLEPRRPMVVVEAGEAVHFVVLGVCGQCRVSLVGLLARACWWRWFVCLSACGVGAGVGRLPVRVAVAVRVGALGAWWAWLGAGARVDVYLVWVAGGPWAAGVLLPCVWRFVLSGGAWLVCALRGRCGSWSAWVVSVWVFEVGCWLWARCLCGVVGRDGGFSDVRGWLVVAVVGGVLSGAGDWGRVGVGWLVVVVVAGLLGGCGGGGRP